MKQMLLHLVLRLGLGGILSGFKNCRICWGNWDNGCSYFHGLEVGSLANYAKALQWSRDTVLYIKPKLQNDPCQYQREPGADE